MGKQAQLIQRLPNKEEKTSSRPPRNGDQRIYTTTMRQDYTIDRDPPSESILWNFEAFHKKEYVS